MGGSYLPSFSVSGATKDSSLSVTERQDVTWSIEVFGSLGGICEGSACKCTIMSRDTGGGAVCVVNRDGVGSLHQLLVVGDHQWELQFI